MTHIKEKKKANVGNEVEWKTIFIIQACIFIVEGEW